MRGESSRLATMPSPTRGVHKSGSTPYVSLTFALALLHALRNPVAKVLVDIAPILDGTLQYWLRHAALEVADDIGDQAGSLRIVQHVAMFL